MSSLPLVITSHIDTITPFLNYLILGVAWSASLVPLLIMLFYFSTPALRVRPIFLMNVVSVAMGIVLGFTIAAITIEAIRHPDEPLDVNMTAFAISSSLIIPIFIDVILALRLYAVFPYRTTSTWILCIVFVPLVLFKVARLTNVILLVVKVVDVLRQRGSTTYTNAVDFEQLNPNHKIEWGLLVVDNCYASAFFLWKIGMGRRIKTSGIASYARDTLTQLFYLGIASFVFPCMLAIVQFVFAFLGSRGYAELYIFVSNVYVEIICSLLATLWVAQNRWFEHRISQQPEASRISFFKDTSHPSNVTNIETNNAVGSQNSSEDSIVKANGEMDARRAQGILNPTTK
ncbi:hypothetical protein PTI98_005756 [Pleurotus ostreatus]|nr:hypothetical protein PTI98_005756 [Pleurotus ostreatus]